METSYSIIANDIYVKLNGKYIISYNELNDLLPKNLFDAEIIEKIIDELEKSGVIFKDDLKSNLYVKKKYKQNNDIIDEFIDNPEKFYFYELYKSEKEIAEKEEKYIERLKNIHYKIKKVFFQNEFLIRLLLKDLETGKNGIMFARSQDIENNIILNLKKYLKKKEDKYLEGINLRKNYIEKKFYEIKRYIDADKQIQEKLNEIQKRYNINTDLFSKLINDIEEGINDINNLSRLEKEIYPIITERKKIKKIVEDYTTVFDANKEILNLYKQYDIIKEKLITLLLPLIINIAKYYQGNGLAVNDLIQEGNIALIEGVERFIFGDIKKPFSQYITKWVRNEMSEVVARNKAVTSISKKLIRDIKKFIKTTKKLRGELLRNPTEEEVREALKWDSEKVRWIIKYLKNPIYLDSKLNESAKNTFKDLIPDTGIPRPEDIAEKNLMREKIDKMLNLLKPIEKEVIKLKFNLNDKVKVNSYEEMAEYLTISIKKIKDIESSALSKLKKLGDKFNLRDFL